MPPKNQGSEGNANPIRKNRLHLCPLLNLSSSRTFTAGGDRTWRFIIPWSQVRRSERKRAEMGPPKGEGAAPSEASQSCRAHL